MIRDSSISPAIMPGSIQDRTPSWNSHATSPLPKTRRWAGSEVWKISSGHTALGSTRIGWSRSRIASATSPASPISADRAERNRMRRGLQPAVGATPLRNARKGRSTAREGHRALFSELGGDGAERRAEIGAHEGESGDSGDCDQRGDQRIFDGGNPGLVPDQVGKNGAQADSPQVSQAIARKLHQTV